MLDEKTKQEQVNSSISLGKVSDELGSLLKAENSYKVSSWFLYALLTIVSFLISLGNAKFDFAKILEAQFWIDFLFTFFGGMLLKYAFGKWGDFEGHKNKVVISAIKDINNDHIEIKEKELLEELDAHIDYKNNRKKLSKIREKTYIKLRKKPKSKKWKKIKECIITQELLLNAKTDEEKDRYSKELDELNFDLETYPIKYNKIRKDTLQTGFSDKGTENDESLSYSEMFELFGKNIALTVFSVIITFILAVTSVLTNSITGAAIFVFATRMATFTMNAYLGFSIGKTGVEKIKLTILKKIHKFLATFIEVATGASKIKG